MYINKDQTEILIKKEAYIFKDTDKAILEAKNHDSTFDVGITQYSCDKCTIIKDNKGKLQCVDVPCSPSSRKDGKNGYFIKRTTTL